MKKIALAVFTLSLMASPTQAGEFDAHLKVCHDTVWQLDEFKAIPNAGVSVFEGGYGGDDFYAYWIIDWDDLQVAGKCLMERKKPILKELTDFRKKG